VNRRFAQAALVLLVVAVTLVPAVAGASPPAAKPLAGPWYTPTELKALIRYSNASFAEKQRILAGESTVSSSSGSFHWDDAGVGAGAVVGIVLGTGLCTRVLRPRRVERSHHA
jgi:monoamine oxidase